MPVANKESTRLGTGQDELEMFETWTIPTAGENILRRKELPAWSRKKLKRYFHQYDWSDTTAPDEDLGLDEDELLQWMQEANQQQSDPPTIDDARAIIEVHDTNGNNVMQWFEMERWFVKASTLSKDERAYLAKQSETSRRSIRFMEFMICACYDRTLMPATEEEHEAGKWLSFLFIAFITLSVSLGVYLYFKFQDSYFYFFLLIVFFSVLFFFYQIQNKSNKK